MANILPNRFVLQSSDGKIKVDYETSTFVGQPALNLTQAPAPPRHFAGSQIRTLATEVGTLVTVTTHITIDSGSTSFSVLIPAISLNGFGDHEAFATEAIITTPLRPDSTSGDRGTRKVSIRATEGRRQLCVHLDRAVDCSRQGVGHIAWINASRTGRFRC